MKSMNNDIKDWHYPFDWDNKVVWALDLPVQEVPIEEYEWILDTHYWSLSRALTFDLKPRDVLNNPSQHPRHSERIKNCDIAFPIDTFCIRPTPLRRLRRRAMAFSARSRRVR